jgi:tight adherence protein B
LTPFVLLGIVLFCVLAGVLSVRVLSIIKRRKLVAKRIQEALGEEAVVELNLIKRSEAEISRMTSFISAPSWLTTMLERSGMEVNVSDFALISVACGLLPALAVYLVNMGELAAIAVGLIFSAVPTMIVSFVAGRRRTKFVEQLPDAIDLMVSVLRSGHSIPPAVRSVARESAEPLGKEFAQVMQRMNLGQPFGESLSLSVNRYRSDELDLIRRAVAIQTEVGGSLAELLDKTNLTLRQRLKLKRQVMVLTSQSRLTGIIVGLLPILLAVALELLNPGYMEPLFTSDLGRMLLGGALGLEILGIFLMKKMTEVKV